MTYDYGAKKKAFALIELLVVIVIGVMGVGDPIENVAKRYQGIHGNFRGAMAAPAALEEFKGNVLTVCTTPFWDMQIDQIIKKRNRYNHPVTQLKNQVRKG